MNQCAICGAGATHFCPGCGKYLCDGLYCSSVAAGQAVAANPVKALAAAPAAAAYFGSRILTTALDALGFKP